MNAHDHLHIDLRVSLPPSDGRIFFPGGDCLLATTYDTDGTVRLARLLATILRSGDVVCMDGDLGAGKTAFAAGLASGLGIQGVIPSPTFTILHEYVIEPGGRLLPNRNHSNPDGIQPKSDGIQPDSDEIRYLYHFDVYRLHGEDDFYTMGFDEYLGSEGSLCILEWAARVRGALPPSAIQILMNRCDEASGEDVLHQQRRILLCFPRGDDRGERLRQLLQETVPVR